MLEQTNTYDSAYPAVIDVVSRNLDNMVLMYGNSQRQTYNAIAFQVTRSVRRIERLENEVTVPANDTVEFGYFGESGHSAVTSNAGDDRFRIETKTDRTIKEFGFAVLNDGVYVGVQTGDGETVTGLREDDERGRGFNAEDLVDRGGVEADLTYIDSPTVTGDMAVPTTALSERAQQGLIRIDSEQDGQNRFWFGFNNTTGNNEDITLIGLGTTYNIRVIEDEQTARDMLAGNGYNRRLVQYGPLGNTNPNLPRQWYDHTISVSGDQLTPL